MTKNTKRGNPKPNPNRVFNHSQQLQERNKKLLQLNTQKVQNLTCPHCKSNKNEKRINPPKTWRNGEWPVTCTSCGKDFVLLIILQIHAMPTEEQLKEMGKKAREDEERARKENGVQTVDTTVGAPQNCEHSQPVCDECKGIGPHTHSDQAVTHAPGLSGAEGDSADSAP